MTYTTYKRWTLHPDASLADVAGLVRERIAPHDRLLSDQVALGLEALEDDRAVLASSAGPAGTPRWPLCRPDATPPGRARRPPRIGTGAWPSENGRQGISA